MHVSLLGRNASVLQALAETLPGQGRKQVVSADVSDATAMQHAVQSAVQAFGPLHVLVNNAGQAVSASIDQTDPVIWQQMLAVNLSGVYHGIHAALPSLRSTATAHDPARIINIASTAGLQGYPHVSAYVAAKHGVVGLTRALALELARQHITVNAVCPGYTETDIVQQAVADLQQKRARPTPKYAPCWRHAIRKNAWCNLTKWRKPCSGCASVAVRPSTDKLLRLMVANWRDEGR